MAEFRPQETNEGACTFHSGYLGMLYVELIIDYYACIFIVPVKPGKENKGYSWSCCKKRTATQHPTHELHARTGLVATLIVYTQYITIILSLYMYMYTINPFFSSPIECSCTSGHHTWRPGKQSNKGHKGGAANKGKGLAADSSDFYVN